MLHSDEMGNMYFEFGVEVRSLMLYGEIFGRASSLATFGDIHSRESEYQRGRPPRY